MNQRYAAIRFVGGPWHNRIMEVALHSIIYVPADDSPHVTIGNGIVRPPAPPHAYYLRHFVQQILAHRPPVQFLQYLHQSLAPFEGQWEYDTFPPLPDDLVNEHLGKLAFLCDFVYAR